MFGSKKYMTVFRLLNYWKGRDWLYGEERHWMDLLVVFSYSAVLFGSFIARFHSSPCRFTLSSSHQRSAGIDFVCFFSSGEHVT